ncbi:MAG: ABC transporter ATP-binding protein, partial [Aquificaceae bacterium]
MKVLELKGVKKSIGQEQILKGIDLSILKGEFVAIIGASGSGKSSMLYIMGLLDRPTEGHVFFEEEKIDFSNEKRLSEIRNRKIGFVFQFHHLLPEFTALENLLIPALIAGMNKKDALARA